FDGETRVSSVLTNALGDAYFTADDVTTPGEYDIVFEDVPAGWSKNSSIIYKTSTESGTSYTVNFEASLITNEPIPAQKLYRLGDVMHDFSLQTCDGDTFVLSEELAQKDMVFLNFWATWCSPCKSEFPAMQNAYSAYSSKVSVIAISTETSDSQTKVASFKDDQGLDFPMVGQPAGGALTAHFDTVAIPVSIVIDRYGVISYIHTGAMTQPSDFINLFDKFIGDSYVQTVIDGSDFGDGGDGEEGEDRLKPTVSPPAISTITPILTQDNTFTFAWDTEDEYSWPWVVETNTDNVKYLTASNTGIHNSYATLTAEFTVTANKVLAFDAYIDTEKTDQLYVLIDDVVIHMFGGTSANPAWVTKYAYVFEAGEEGAHTLTFIYMKDGDASHGEDKVNIKNLRFEDASILNTPTTDLNVFHNAVSGFNKPETLEAGENKKTKFQNYVDVALGSDGYYHVIPEEGTPVDISKHPILFANIMSPTVWNAYSVWQIAYLGYAVYDGHNLEDLVEQFAWACTHSSNSYVPVTKELKDILDIMVREEVVGEAYDKTLRNNVYFDPEYHVSYHEKEWLEVCVYYKHYGQTPVMGDPTRGITFDGAIPLQLNTVNHIVCDQSIVPLGIKHKINITQAGVYHFYSLVDDSLENTDSSYDPQCWIFAEDRTTILAESDDFLLHSTGNPDNFDVYLYLEEGTYYCLFAMFLNDLGEFDMRIDFVNNTRFDYFTNCAIGPRSFNPVTNETFVPNAQYYKYDEAQDCYRITNKQGVFLADLYAGLDDKIYLDLTKPTYLFPDTPLSKMIEEAESKKVTERLFYMQNADGTYTDYTQDMKQYLFLARRNNDELNGRIAIDKHLMDIILLLMKYYDGFGGVENSWQLMSYYYKPIVKEVDA
ncbi:MAG: TlpA family protein disulfide reductase, partial [Clostridia bacterium]|nr:TlpA family protein disulfide reductase [Clostridia bacterium]